MGDEMMRLVITGIFMALFYILMDNIFQDFYNKYVQSVLNYSFHVSIFMILIITFLLFLAFNFYDKNKENKITKLNSKINVYQQDLRSDTKDMWRHYHDLNKFFQNEITQKLMNVFVNQNNVVAIQIYKYNFRERNDKLTIKINHECGYVVEDEPLNGIVQDYFEIDGNIYKRFKNAIKKLDGMETAHIEKMINQFNKELKTTDIQNLKSNKSATIKYTILWLCIEFFLEKIAEHYKQADLSPLSDVTREEILHKNKRTGIFRGILYFELNGGDNYKFFHDKSNNKKGRIYLTKAAKINGIKCLFLITLYAESDKSKLEMDVENLNVAIKELFSNNSVDIEFYS